MYDAIHVSTLDRTGVKVDHLVPVVSGRFPYHRDWSGMLGLGLGMHGHTVGAAVKWWPPKFDFIDLLTELALVLILVGFLYLIFY